MDIVLHGWNKIGLVSQSKIFFPIKKVGKSGSLKSAEAMEGLLFNRCNGHSRNIFNYAVWIDHLP